MSFSLSLFFNNGFAFLWIVKLARLFLISIVFRYIKVCSLGSLFTFGDHFSFHKFPLASVIISIHGRLFSVHPKISFLFSIIPSACSYLSCAFLMREYLPLTRSRFEVFKNNRYTADCVCIIIRGWFLLPLLLTHLMLLLRFSPCVRGTRALVKTHSFDGDRCAGTSPVLPLTSRAGRKGSCWGGGGRHVSTGGRPSAAAGVCWLRAPQHGCALSPLYGHDYVDLLAIVGTWWVRSYFDGSLRMLFVERDASRRNKTANVVHIKTLKKTRRTSTVRKITCTLLVTTNIVLLGPSVQKGALYGATWPNDRPGENIIWPTW